MPKKILIFDTTLRDGEQSPGGSLTISEKVLVAKQLAKLGVDVIEAGFPIASPGDFEAVTEISKILKNSIQVKKKRKPTIKEEWIDFRVFLYGFMRMKAIFSAVMNAKDKFDKKFKYGEQTLVAATKFPNKKSFFSVFNRNNNEYSDVKIEGVKQTIKKCLDLSIYWKKRKYFFKNKSIPEKNDARAFNDEAQEYFRSITSYVKNDKYNADFYSNNKYFDEMLSVVEIKEDREKLRKAYFSSQNWIWYEEVR